MHMHTPHTHAWTCTPHMCTHTHAHTYTHAHMHYTGLRDGSAGLGAA